MTLRDKSPTTPTVWKSFVLLLGGLALVACAHHGGVIFPSPTVEYSDAAIRVPLVPTPREPNPGQASLLPTGGATIEPDPSILDIRSVPTRHRAVDLVSTRSAVITASPGGAPVVVHNNGELLGADGCAAVHLAPEGDTRLTVILAETGGEFRSRFYLVGCSPGDATLTIVSEGELLNVYEFTVLPP